MNKGEWEEISVGEIVEETVGGAWGKEEPYKDFAECKVIRGTDFPNIPLFKIEKIPTRYIKQQTIDEKQVKVGDLVIELSGGSKNQATGRCVYITQEFLDLFDTPVLCSNFCRIIRVKDDKVNPLWFYWYWSQTYNEGTTFKYENQPSGIKNFQLDEFLVNELINIPDVKTQEDILKLFGDFHEIQANGRRMSYLIDDVISKAFERIYYRDQLQITTEET
ncbi:restriction endonuclease subunit S [Bacillus velezensis]|uniref:restriction endonuclease subunit S n=1 Tax=Bacillus velezensis TaxID=492670 RepID=UPI00217691AC|nr:restriction endonuclease subunit S [Bacillus velezensis]